MRLALFLFLFASLSFGVKLPDRCEVKYRKCVFDCVQEFPLDKEKRGGCETRCKLDRGLCKTKETVEKLGKSVKEFLEGFFSEKKESI